MKLRITMILLMASLYGCSEFLEETSQDEIRPSTVRDIEKLLEGEAYFSGEEGYIFNRGTDIFTDDVQCNVLAENMNSYTTKKENGRYRFIWEKTMFDEEGGGQDITFWQLPYERINRCNLILEYIDGMDGSEAEREHLKGEAYTLRGFYYLMLVNFFGLPYNFGDPEQNLGVPLKLDSGVTDDRLERNSVAECYEQIEKDLLRGTELMRQNSSQQSLKITRLGYLAGYALLSRMYLYMGNYDKALMYADSVLFIKQDLLDLNNSISTNVYYSSSSTEILWAGVETFTDFNTTGKMPYTPSSSLISVFGQDVDGQKDLRCDYNNVSWNATVGSSYLKRGSCWNAEIGMNEYWVSHIAKGDIVTSNNFYNAGVRLAELYLNRAEVLARRYVETGNREDGEAALVALNTLRRHRFETGYVDKQLSDFMDGNALLDFCLRERRRELCAEGNHRWFDLRRLGMPFITHVYVDDSGYETEYVLQEEDPRYALPIPEEVIRKNSNLVQN